MTPTLRDVARWSIKPAKNVETAITPKVNVLRGLAARATTPLSARRLPQTAQSVVVGPRTARRGRRRTQRDGGLGHGDDQAGLGILRRLPARPVRRHRPAGRRPLALAVVLADLDPRRDKKLITITVKATPEGFLSTHLVNGVKPGTIVRLGGPQG